MCKSIFAIMKSINKKQIPIKIGAQRGTTKQFLVLFYLFLSLLLT